jgi:hypothetical protein
MNLITYIEVPARMRRTLMGARASDPVLPDRPRYRRN